MALKFSSTTIFCHDEKTSSVEESEDSWIVFSETQEIVSLSSSTKFLQEWEDEEEDEQITEEDNEEESSEDEDEEDEQITEEDNEEASSEDEDEEDEIENDTMPLDDIVKKKKKVQFNLEVQIFEFEDDEESKEMRKCNWEATAADFLRFRHRIKTTEETLTPFLNWEFRSEVYRLRFKPFT